MSINKARTYAERFLSVYFKLCDENSHENILNYVSTYRGTRSFVTEIGDVTLRHFTMSN